MAEATLYHGVALVGYVNGVPVDANGNEVKGAPKEPPSTDPSRQPHGMAALNAEERSAAILANALATALGKKAPEKVPAEKAAESGASESETADGELPTVAELDAHLAGITSIDEVKALKRKDHRATAKAKYDARIAALKGE